MIDPDRPFEMIDMIGDFPDIGRRHRIRRIPAFERRIGRGRVAGIERLQPRLLGGTRKALRADVGVEEARQEDDHHDPAVRLDERQHAVGGVARMRVHRAHPRMAEHHRRFRDFERVLHRRLADMAQIDDHADAVHLAHDLAPEVVEAIERGRVGRAVGPRDILRMRQRHIARAEIVHLAQHGERRSDRLAALHPHHAGDLAGLHRPFELGRIGGEREIVRIARDEPFRDVDLFERLLHRLLLIAVRRHIDRPELRADMAPAQTPKVGVHRDHRRIGVGFRRVGGVDEIEVVDDIARAPAQRPRHVIMPVEHRRLF